MVGFLCFLVFVGTVFFLLSPALFEFEPSGWITVAVIWMSIVLIGCFIGGVYLRRAFDEHAPAVKRLLATYLSPNVPAARRAASVRTVTGHPAQPRPLRPALPLAGPRLVVQCPACTRRLRVVADGRRYRCPNCAHHLGRFDIDPP